MIVATMRPALSACVALLKVTETLTILSLPCNLLDDNTVRTPVVVAMRDVTRGGMRSSPRSTTTRRESLTSDDHARFCHVANESAPTPHEKGPERALPRGRQTLSFRARCAWRGWITFLIWQVRILAAGLQGNSTLTSLDLSHNKIADRGVKVA